MAGSSGTAPWTEGWCPQLQTRFNEHFQAENPEFKMEHVGLLEATLDYSQGITELQRSGVKNEGTNEGPTVEVIFNQRYTADNTKTTDPTCAGETERANCSTTYSIDQYFRSDEMIFTEDQMKRICESGESFTERAILSMMNGMAERANENLHTQLTANAGAFRVGLAGTPGTYTILNADGSTRYTGEAQMAQDLRSSLLSGRFALIGTGNWDIYTRNQLIGTAQDTGTNIAQTKAYDFYFDPYVANANSLNDADQAFVIGRDAFKYSQWAFNAGEGYPKSNDLFMMGTIMHPQTGLLFDINATYTYCGRNNRQWVVYLEHTYGYGQFPANIWQNNDPNYGVNYTFTVTGNQAP